MVFMWRLGLFGGLILSITACGQNGVLYLPPDTPPTPTNTTAPPPTQPQPTETPTQPDRLEKAKI